MHSVSTAVLDAPFEYVGEELDVFAHARRWKAYFGQQLRPFVRGRVLEVGAGFGATTAVLLNERVEHWTCLEPDRDLAARLERATRTEPHFAGRPLQVAVGTLADIPAESGFDTILYIDVLEHIEHDGAELEQAAARLAPGGALVVLSPAHQWLFSPFDAAIGHFRRYNHRLLRSAGPAALKLVRMRYLDSVGLLASLANRTLLRSSMPTAGQIGFWDRAMVPVSRCLDPVLGYRLGKSIVGIWRRGQ